MTTTPKLLTTLHPARRRTIEARIAASAGLGLGVPVLRAELAADDIRRSANAETRKASA